MVKGSEEKHRKYRLPSLHLARLRAPQHLVQPVQRLVVVAAVALRLLLAAPPAVLLLRPSVKY